MGECRIYELSNVAYDGELRIPVDSETKGTGSIKLSDLPFGQGGTGGSTVVGSIVPYGGTDTPDGFLYCDGSEVSKESYSDLYAVIGDKFGTATDPLKFKLPKIDDARYLQGNTTPGTEVAAGLPKPTISNSGGNHTHTIGHFSVSTGTAGIAGVARSTSQGWQGSGSTSEATVTIASTVDDDTIYGKSDTVTPKSVTVRYLICWKKTIAKADTVMGMPDWGTKKGVDFTSETNKEVTENGYILFKSEYTWAGEQQLGYVNDVEVFQFYGDPNDCASSPYGVVPVSIGDKVKVSSKTYVTATFYPAKATPAKISELYMGAPDYSATTVTVTDGWRAPANGWIRVNIKDSFEGTWAAAIFINNSEVASAYHDNSTASTSWQDCQTSLVPISKDDTVTFNADAQTYLDVVFFPRKKIQIDASDITAVGGGVVDGTILDTSVKTISTSITKISHTAKNDCWLVGEFKDVSFNVLNLKATIGDNFISYIHEGDPSGMSADGDTWSFAFPVKKGKTVNITRKDGDGALFKTVTGGNVTFYEYKLTALAPQIAFPDWDKNKKENVTVFPYMVSKNGYLYICISNAGKEAQVYVNGEEVHYTCTAVYGDSCGVVPVSKGDVVTVDGEFEKAAIHSVTFYPAKIIQQTTDDIQTVKTVNDISPDGNGNINLGYTENELYKFKKVNSFEELNNNDIKSGFCYYTLSENTAGIEGKPLRYIDKMCIAQDIWSFVTPTTHTAILDAGTYEVVAVAGGGLGGSGWDGWSQWSGGSGAAISAQMTISEQKTFEITVGNNTENTSISCANVEILHADHGVDGVASWSGETNYGKGGLVSKCSVNSSYFTSHTIYKGNDGGYYKQEDMRYAYGGNYALPQYPYGGGQGGWGTSYNPQSGYVRIQKIS